MSNKSTKEFSPSPANNDEDEDSNRIPMADEDEEDEEDATTADESQGESNLRQNEGPESLTSINILEDDDDGAGGGSGDLNNEEQEEKARLIAQVLELQNTLDDLSSRVDNVKEENLRLRSENQVLGQYIENLMAASNVFQPANGAPSPAVGGARGATSKKK